MNYYKQKHKVLKFLTFSNNFQLDENNLLKKGLSFKDILNNLNVSETELNIIISELYENKEIKKGNDGLIIEKKGISSFSNNFYIKESRNYKLNLIKDYVQIIVPILTSIIAIIAVSNNNTSKIERKLNEIEKQLKVKNRTANTSFN